MKGRREGGKWNKMEGGKSRWKSSKAIVSHVCMIHPGLYSIAHPLVCYILLNVLLGNSSGWRADTVATYSKSRNLQLTKKNKTKYGERGDTQHCTTFLLFLAREVHLFLILLQRSWPHLACVMRREREGNVWCASAAHGSPWEIFLEEGGKIQAALLIPSVGLIFWVVRFLIRREQWWVL